MSSKGLTVFLSFPCALPQPPFYSGKNTAGTHLWVGGLERDFVFQMPLTQRCKHYLLFFLSVLFNKFILPCKGDFGRG